MLVGTQEENSEDSGVRRNQLKPFGTGLNSKFKFPRPPWVTDFLLDHRWDVCFKTLERCWKKIKVVVDKKVGLK